MNIGLYLNDKKIANLPEQPEPQPYEVDKHQVTGIYYMRRYSAVYIKTPTGKIKISNPEVLDFVKENLKYGDEIQITSTYTNLG